MCFRLICFAERNYDGELLVHGIYPTSFLTSNTLKIKHCHKTRDPMNQKSSSISPGMYNYGLLEMFNMAFIQITLFSVRLNFLLETTTFLHTQ